jgi:hypothetical protein
LAVTEPEVQSFLVTVQFSLVIFRFGKPDLEALVFSEEGAKRFPPECPEDLEIKLEEGAPKTINCRTFNLTKDESKAMKEFLDENLAKGYISQSNTPWSTPAFFIKKTGGGF